MFQVNQCKLVFFLMFTQKGSTFPVFHGLMTRKLWKIRRPCFFSGPDRSEAAADCHRLPQQPDDWGLNLGGFCWRTFCVFLLDMKNMKFESNRIFWISEVTFPIVNWGHCQPGEIAVRLLPIPSRRSERSGVLLGFESHAEHGIWDGLKLKQLEVCWMSIPKLINDI